MAIQGFSEMRNIVIWITGCFAFGMMGRFIGTPLSIAEGASKYGDPHSSPLAAGGFIGGVCGFICLRLVLQDFFNRK
jgi:hypothetical protein